MYIQLANLELNQYKTKIECFPEYVAYLYEELVVTNFYTLNMQSTQIFETL